MKPTRIVGRGSSGCAARYATAAITSATPALSSAPSSVSPLVVTMSWPTLGGELRHPLRVEHGAVARERDHAAVVVAVDERLDARAGRVRAGVHVREQADHRSRPRPWPGSVAVTKPWSSIAASARPISSSSDDEQARQLELPRRARATARRRGRTGCRCGRSGAGGPARRARAPRRAPRNGARSCGTMLPCQRSGRSATSGCCPPQLVAELAAAGVERVIDVRFRPQSRRPGMSKTRLGRPARRRTASPTSTGARSAPRRTCATTSTRAGSRRRGRATARTSRPTRRRRSTSWPTTSSTGRGPRCCASRRIPPAATGGCSARLLAERLAGLEVVDL